MEENMQYMMWLKSNQALNLSSNFNTTSSSSSSWEEQAFAEDVGGPLALGGYAIWPPRSYTCSFCRREFRSAQALGGHMNVHRRDRARLKQSLCTDNNIIIDQDHATDYSSTTSPFSSSTPVSWVTVDAAAAVASQETNNPSELEAYYNYVSSFSSSSNINKEQLPLFPQYLSSPADSRTATGKSTTALWKQEVVAVLEPDHDHDDHATVETDLSVGINNSHITDLDHMPPIISSKRFKSTSGTAFPFMYKSAASCSSSERFPFQYDLMSRASSIDQDIDLELRLGDLPAVT